MHGPVGALLLSSMLAAMLCAMPAASASERIVQLPVPGLPAPLVGTLGMPESGVPGVPGVLILPGSGPTDRDGNQPALHNDSLRLVSAGLNACGIATLRIDKRGVGASRPAADLEEDILFGDYVADAVRWLALLRGQPGIRGVSVLGHSEGGLFALLAAQKTRIDRLVLIAAPGRPAGAVLRGQIAASPEFAPAMRRRATALIDRLEAGETVEDVPQGLAFLFRGAIQPYLIEWFRHDPAVELARTAVPALVVWGSTDLQVGSADFERLAAARPGVQRLRIEGMNHVLRTAPQTWRENMATYAAPDLPLAPGLVGRLCAFLR